MIDGIKSTKNLNGRTDAVLQQIEQILHNKPVYQFFKASITDGYLANSGEHASEMQELLDTAFKYIEVSLKLGTNIREVTEVLSHDIFRASDPTFWFTELYTNFKRTVKPVNIVNAYRPQLVGHKILNIGCGDGLYSKLLAKEGYEVALADVLDFRDSSATSLPFQQMTTTTALPYPDGFADTTLILSVLHHVNLEDVKPLLQEVKRVSRRIIIEEESYGIEENREEFEDVINADQRLNEFIHMPNDDQIQYMKLLDYFSNVVIMNVPDMNFPFGYKKINEWRQLFSEIGFTIEKTTLIGFGRFHRTGRVAFVLNL